MNVLVFVPDDKTRPLPAVAAAGGGGGGGGKC